ncbi:2-hydroxychromene-2-carboxylate isomerase [Parvularcula lutaonensis]|uniref:2-hydroxychromene-2-carboxylate isomerase n=1 Tax=Parvularcula lutaonensis TaxID=491923 RepID=A0ABV7M8W2_9PROT|nr:2-hydroxychromene-2-carboxylate isomerase [Parvularcula lutaonensis]GGY41718.1 2-hydroxychromene-2-carboxylate isomerase [Parvularcula lutaonensis]
MTPEFLYDYGSPNAYLAWRVLPEIEARTDVVFRRTPVLLGGIFKETGNQSPFYRFGPVKGRMEYEMLEMRRFMKKHKITDFQMNHNFPQNSLLMMRGAVAAHETGQGEAYDRACFRGMWEENLQMDNVDVFTDRLDKEGLRGSAILQKAQSPEVKAKLAEMTNAAVTRGVFGLPSFFVGDELFFGKDRLGDVELEILRQKNA